MASTFPTGPGVTGVNRPEGETYLTYEAREEESSTMKYHEATEDGATTYQSINAGGASGGAQHAPQLSRSGSSRANVNSNRDDLFTSLSQRQQGGGKQHDTAEMAEINRLLTQMFGSQRKQSADDKARHLGVTFKGLTVKGKGIGAALQPDLSAPFAKIAGKFSKNKPPPPTKAAKKPPVRTLISDFNGVIKPGELVLVLGKPGSGCSTFLKVIANQRFGYEAVDGEVTYGGTSAAEMAAKHRGEINYNPEDDIHYATLSVKDTLQFALKTRTPGPEGREEGESAAEYQDKFYRVLLKLFWIEHTANTKLGNDKVRGVSGGEKKRVSIAEAMITRASTQCWDNSTRGLDASTAREYVESLRALTDMANIATAAALYQVGESLYELFDKVMLIDEGHCLYYGPTHTAQQYFEELGFVKPERWTTADFLTSVSDSHERRVREGMDHRIPRSALQFSEAFRASQQAKDNLRELDAFSEEAKAVAAERDSTTSSTKRSNYAIPFHKQVLACTVRQAKVMHGDPSTIYGKWVIVFIQSLIIGSLFYNLPKTALGVFPRGGILFLSLLFNALLALAELSAAFASRPILQKHKTFSFYRPAAFALGQIILDVPLIFMQVFVFDTTVYFLSNLARTPSQYFISLLFLWLTTMVMYAFFRALGSVFSSLDGATKVTGLAIQIMVLYTGYLIPPSAQHPWFSWLRHIDPIRYSFEALMANEFYNLEIECVPPYLVPRGPNVQSQYQSCTIQGGTPGSPIVQGASYILTEFGYRRDHLWRNFGILCGFFTFFALITVFGTETQKPTSKGGAVTIYKQGQVPKGVAEAMSAPDKLVDEETGAVDIAKLDDRDSAQSSSEEEPTKALIRNETVFTWSNVNYTIPYGKGTRQLLRDQQGFVRPGKLTALMGSSGAGKTTLLTVLAQRTQVGTVTGDFLVDGRPLPTSFQRSSGFVEQGDIHEPTTTVREALEFSAKLRQPAEVPLADKYAYVDEVLRLLEMESIAGAVVGVPGAGLNQEQRKRLTIGVELVARPELLMFLDEPTSGLDSAAAFNIIRLLKKLSMAGQAILCTIHQPSAVLFENFDELLLLQAGGRIVYHGELGRDSRTLVDYLEANGAAKCPPADNPAEYMLEAIGAGNPDYKGHDWSEVWAASQEREDRRAEIARMVETRSRAEISPALQDQREYAMPFGAQLSTVMGRTFRSAFRTPQYVVGKIFLHIITALFNTFTFFHLRGSTIDMQSRIFSTFLVLTTAPPLIQQLQPRFLAFRDLYSSREGKSKIYDWKAFAISAYVVEIPFGILAGTLFWATWYWPTWFPRGTDASASVWLWLMSFQFYYISLGQAIASFAPNVLLASILVPVFFLFTAAFCGIIVPYAAMPYFWRSWLYWLTPFRYLIEGVVSTLIHDVPVICKRSEYAIFSAPPGQTCQEYVQPFIDTAGGYVVNVNSTVPGLPGAVGDCAFCQYANGDEFGRTFNFFYDLRWRDYGIFWAYIVFNTACIFFFTWLMLVGGKKIKKNKAAKQAKKAQMLESQKKPAEEKTAPSSPDEKM